MRRSARSAASTCCRPRACMRMCSIAASTCRFFACGASSNATRARRASSRPSAAWDMCSPFRSSGSDRHPFRPGSLHRSVTGRPQRRPARTSRQAGHRYRRCRSQRLDRAVGALVGQRMIHGATPPPRRPRGARARRRDARDIRRCRGCRSPCRRPGSSCPSSDFAPKRFLSASSNDGHAEHAV